MRDAGLPLRAGVDRDDDGRRLLRSLLYYAAIRSYALIDADRIPRPEALDANDKGEDDQTMATLLAEGRLKEGLSSWGRRGRARLSMVPCAGASVSESLGLGLEWQR